LFWCDVYFIQSTKLEANKKKINKFVMLSRVFIGVSLNHKLLNDLLKDKQKFALISLLDLILNPPIYKTISFISLVWIIMIYYWSIEVLIYCWVLSCWTKRPMMLSIKLRLFLIVILLLSTLSPLYQFLSIILPQHYFNINVSSIYLELDIIIVIGFRINTNF